MRHSTLCRTFMASVLVITATATAWAQSSAGLGRIDYQDNCASCHGLQGKGDGLLHSFLVKPPSDLTTIAQRHGGQFPQELVWEMMDGRWAAEAGPHGSREMPVWGNVFKQRAIAQLGDSPSTAEWSLRKRIVPLLKYLESIQKP